MSNSWQRIRKFCNQQQEKIKVRLSDRISLRGQFRHPDSDFVLNLNLELPLNKFIIITGQHRSGKTSLVQCLAGKMRGAGQVSIPQAGSFYLKGDPVISDSILNNILLFNTYNSQNLEQIIKICCLQKDIQNFEGGFQMKVVDYGSNLSTGQKSRVCLARTLYLQNDFYILDQPFDFLDKKVRSTIFKNVYQHLKGKSVILTSNNNEVFQYADIIILLDKGEVVFRGGPQEYFTKQSEHKLDENQVLEEEGVVSGSN